MGLEHDDSETAAKQEQPPIILRIEGPDLSLRREIDEGTVVKIMALLVSGGPSQVVPPVVGGGSGRVGQSADIAGRPESLPEFYHTVSPQKYPEKLVTLGAYLFRSNGQGSFSPDELRAMFRQVSEPQPGNIHRDLSVAISRGWIAKDPAGGYFVTNSGFRALEASFAVEAKRSSPRRRKSRKNLSVEGQ